MNKALNFSIYNEDDLKAFAIITAEWVKQGVTFKVEKNVDIISLYLTGGF